MKENILKILSEIQLRNEFKGAEYTLTLNYEEIFSSRLNKREFSMFKRDPLPDIMDKEVVSLFNKKIDEVGDIYIASILQQLLILEQKPMIMMMGGNL